MYKMNLLLKILILVTAISSVIIIRNSIFLWLIFLIPLFVHFILNKRRFCIIDFILFMLLFFIDDTFSLIFFKVLFIINSILTLYMFLNSKDLIYFKSLFVSSDNEEYLKKNFYDEYRGRVSKYNKRKTKDNYNSCSNLNKKVDDDLERLYVQSRIRFYGIKNKKHSYLFNNWDKIDTMILLFLILLFIIVLLLGR